MTLAIEMVKNKQKGPIPGKSELRPLGSVVYFMPSYIITPNQIDTLAEVAWQGIELATKD